MKKLILIIILASATLIGRAQRRVITDSVGYRTVMAKRAQAAMLEADHWFDLKSYANASSSYNSVLSLDSVNFKALRRMGYCVMNLPGGEQDALGYFYRALNQQPNDPVSNYYLGVIFLDEAKAATDDKVKTDFKAKAAVYLNAAAKYGSADAKAAIKDLNAI